MRCQEFEARLNDLLDLRLDPTDDRPLGRHAEQCAGCRALLASYIAVVTSLDVLPAPSSDDDLPRRVLQQWSCVSRDRHHRSYTPHLVSAAALLLAALLLIRSTPERRAVVPQSHLAERLRIEAIRPAVDTEHEFPKAGSTTDEPEATLPDLHETASGVLTDVAQLWPKLPDAEGVWLKWGEAESLLSVAALPDVEQTPAAMELAGGLKPLADSTDAAIRFLFDVFSGASAANRSTPGAPAGAAPPRLSDEAS